MTHSGPHERARERRGEDAPTAVYGYPRHTDPPTAVYGHPYPEPRRPRPRRRMFPRGWRDAPYAALTALLVALIVVLATGEWILLGRP